MSRSIPSLLPLLAAFLSLAHSSAPFAGQQESGDASPPTVYEPHPLDKLADYKVGHIALKIIDSHGTWESWEKLNTVDFTWEWRIYPSPSEAGEPVTERVRMHLNGPLRFRIDRPDERVVMVYNDGEHWILEDGKIQTKKEKEIDVPTLAWSTYFFFTVPFNFPLEGFELHYNTQTAEDMIVDVKVDESNREGPIEKFTVFSDLSTWRIHKILYEVAGQYQVMQLSDYDRVDGIEIPHTRITSQSFSNGEPRRILLETVVREVKFNAYLDEALFAKPPGPPEESWKPSVD